MAESSVERSGAGRNLPAVVSALVHAGCWLALLVLLWGPVAAWIRAADEGVMLLDPIILKIVLPFSTLVIHYPLGTLMCLVLFVVADFLVLRYLDRSGMAREIWSGAVVWSAVYVLFLLAMSVILNSGQFAVDMGRFHAVVYEQQRLQNLEPLMGTWSLVGEEQRGESIAKAELTSGELVIERHENFRLRPGGADPQYFRLTLGEKERHGQVSLWTRSATQWIEFVDTSGESVHWQQLGIYRLDGNRLVLCLSPPGIGGADLPTDFSTKESDNVLYVFERRATN